MRQIILALIIVTCLSMAGCANIGSPTGGPEDETAPVLINSTPRINQTNFNKDKVVLYFDEIVVLKELKKNFIVSPPLEKNPTITAMGKKVSINLNNDLLDSTTYTIYLGSSIVDNNQGNPLPDLTFSFSTGDVVDSMELRGILLQAKDLEPISGSVVGIYSDLSDSAVIKNTPLRIGQTNDKGEFIIKNVAPGKYHIFGLTEMIRNYRYDNPSDEIAFLDSIIIPDYDTIQVYDTVWQDSITIDSIIMRDALRYGPRNITLLSFSEFEVALNIKKKERPMPGQLLYTFSRGADTIPRIKLEDDARNDWYLTEKTVTGDTVIYWITDSAIYKKDTISIVLEYLKTDTLQEEYWETDTFSMVYRQPKVQQSKRSKRSNAKKPSLPVLRYETNANGKIGINSTLQFTFDEPLMKFHSDSILLYSKDDTLKTPIPFTLKQHPDFIRRYNIKGDFEPGEAYSIVLDSAAMVSIFGLAADAKASTFSVKKEDEYGNLTFTLTDTKGNGVLMLLNKSGKTLLEKSFSNEQQNVSFELLLPGTYYAMLFYDTNNDGEWTAGSYLNRQQAEEVRFFNKVIEIKPYRDYEEDWYPERISIAEQKPDALKKEKKN